ncbi:hypothetical protein PFISCL1PPCAC_10824, partial [Pristionchus fissidentatus]
YSSRMTPVETGDGESSFKQECKESTLQKMRTMCQLSEAMGTEGGIQLASLVPIANIITAIVNKDRREFNHACSEIRAHIQQKNHAVSLQNLASIAEINFLEGFDTFISYIYQGNCPREEEQLNTQSSNTSIQNSPIKSPPKRRAPKRSQEGAHNELALAVVPVKRLAAGRQSQAPAERTFMTPKKTQEESMAVRKSARRLIEDLIKFSCVFTGCTEEFKFVKDLAVHAERCTHKAGRVLNFRCSVCKRTFKTDKSIKGHMGSWQNTKCTNGSIEIEAVREEPMDNSTPMNVTVVEKEKKTTPVLKMERKSEEPNENIVKCNAKGCKYSSALIDSVYMHVRNVHSDCNQLFKCLECGETRASGKAIQNHLKWSCLNAKIELNVFEKEDGNTEPKATHVMDSPTTSSLTALRSCPAKGCGFVSTAARFIPIHFNQYHSPSTLSYRCSTCKMTTPVVQAIIAHAKMCANSRPVPLVNGQPIKKGPSTRSSLIAASTSRVVNKRGRPSLTRKTKKDGGVKKGMRREEEGGDGGMPVLELIDASNEDDVNPAVRDGETREEAKEEDVDVEGIEMNNKETEGEKKDEEVVSLLNDASVPQIGVSSARISPSGSHSELLNVYSDSEDSNVSEEEEKRKGMVEEDEDGDDEIEEEESDDEDEEEHIVVDM